ncbi:MAG: hypothetical protein APR63_02015 [Desulfuromonas sp. SDB]|nr:MAG: hypothetical protein APR63_02015 [Desulfuromonas sp. SDB]
MGDLGNKLRNAGDWLAKHIPGFAGYVKREERRRADKIFRDYLVGKLRDAKSRLSRATVKITDSGDLNALKTLSRVEAKYETVTDRLRLADYGYTGWFDTVQIDFDELDKLYEFDVNLTMSVDQICKIAQDMEAGSSEEASKLIMTLNQSLDELDKKLKQRDNLFIQELNFNRSE